MSREKCEKWSHFTINLTIPLIWTPESDSCIMFPNYLMCYNFCNHFFPLLATDVLLTSYSIFFFLFLIMVFSISVVISFLSFVLVAIFISYCCILAGSRFIISIFFVYITICYWATRARASGPPTAHPRSFLAGGSSGPLQPLFTPSTSRVLRT